MRRSAHERGAALLLMLVTLVALLGIGAMTLVAVRPAARPLAPRHQSEALYAAESGVAAALSWLAGGCEHGELPARPAHPELFGNGVAPGEPGNPFDPAAGLSYEVTVDRAGERLLVRSLGRRGRVEVIVEAEVEEEGCPGVASAEAAFEVTP